MPSTCAKRRFCLTFTALLKLCSNRLENAPVSVWYFSKFGSLANRWTGIEPLGPGYSVPSCGRKAVDEPVLSF